MTKIRDLLKAKSIQGVLSVSPTATVTEAVKVLGKHNVGALVVMDQGKPVGIISERDILRRAITSGLCDLEQKKVTDVMTREVIIGVPEDDVAYVSSIMIKSKIRHLPIIQEKKVIGLISIGDVVNAQISEEKYENKMLRDYIEGKYPG